MKFLERRIARIRRLFAHEIWEFDVHRRRCWRARLFVALRVVSMTATGVRDNSLASRAGALSYSSMLGLGPLVALVVLFSSIVLERSDPNFAVNQLNRALVFIAPQIGQLRDADPTPAGSTDEAGAEAPTAEGFGVNPELVGLLEGIIEASQTKAIGIIGALALIAIVIQLFSTIENAFNDIWGVRRGRNWLLRIAFYWAAVTLGAVVAFAALTLLSASTVITMIESLPLGPELRRFFQFAGPSISVVVLVGVLTVFYKAIPNTSVHWRPALIGAVVVVLLINLNNYLAFLYLRNVMVSQTLYGSLALIPIIMLGLYVFWLFLLLGGQITYAIQNAHFRSSNIAWHGLHHTARQGTALLVFTLIARRFRACLPACSAQDLAEAIKLPTQILNACLERLIAVGLVTRIPPEDTRTVSDYRFQPARPLERITLHDFQHRLDGLGVGPSRELLDSIDPVVAEFHARTLQALESALGEESFETILDRLASSPTLRTGSGPDAVA